MNPVVEGLLAVCRFLHDGAAMMLWGSSAWLALQVPPKLAQDLARRLFPVIGIAAALLVLSLLAMLPLKTAMIVGDWHRAFEPDLWTTILAATSVGTAWLVDAGASLLAVIALLLPGMLRTRLLAVATALVLASLALTGHTMLHKGWLGILHQANDILHVLAAGAWVGALVPLTVMLAHFPHVPGDTPQRQALDRFSVAGRIAVSLTVLTGAANTWFTVGGWPLNQSSPYQVLLLMKILLVVLMIALASSNHFHFTPKLERTPLTGAAAIRRGAISEILLGAGAIALVAIFGLFQPTP